MANRNAKKRGKPFEIGNPGGPGRPKGSISIIGKIKQIWENEPERFEAYVEEVLADEMMHKEIVQQIDGKPVQPLANADGEPFVIKLISYGDNHSASIPSKDLPA